MKLLHPHPERKLVCSMKDNITKLLGLEDVIVKKIEEAESEIEISIELPRKAHECPCCGGKTDRIHDYRRQRIRDCQAFGKPVYLSLKKRRYICRECGKRFYERNGFLPRYHRRTQREIAAIISGFRELVSAKHISVEHGISVNTALRYFDLVSYGTCKLPRVLSMDEFKGNADGEKFQTILTDAENHKVLDILPNRKSHDLIEFFLKFPREERLKVEYVVMDMSTIFYSVAQTCFPKATVVADRYHVVRQAAWAMENVRKDRQKKLSPEWRRYCKRSRYLLNKAPEKLSEEESDKLRVLLGISTDLEYAYKLKNSFRELMRSPDSNTGKRLLADWVYFAESSGLKEFSSCTKAVHNWSGEILASFDCPYSNGYTEGCNNKTKVLKRVCFGVRSFARLRNRILLCAAGT